MLPVGRSRRGLLLLPRRRRSTPLPGGGGAHAGGILGIACGLVPLCPSNQPRLVIIRIPRACACACRSSGSGSRSRSRRGGKGGGCSCHRNRRGTVADRDGQTPERLCLCACLADWPCPVRGRCRGSQPSRDRRHVCRALGVI
jgi:hypothetical protein